MKILIVSDIVDPVIYSLSLKDRYGDIDFILSCGDLPFYYLDFISTHLGKPLYYVFGNHDKKKENKMNYMCETTINDFFKHTSQKNIVPEGAEPPSRDNNLDNKIRKVKNLLIGGFEGSMRYNRGNHQYTESQMRRKVVSTKLKLHLNKIMYKRYIDILVTHAPPFGINDGKDLCHQGFKIFLKYLDKYKPKYLLHGHVHVYASNAKREVEYKDTTIINTYGHYLLEIPENN